MVEGGCLLSNCTAFKPYRGFESHSLRSFRTESENNAARYSFFTQLRYTPTSAQARIHAALDHPGRNAVFARIAFGNGLTTALINEALYQAAHGEKRVLLLSPSFITSRIRHMAEADVLSGRVPFESRCNIGDKKILFMGGAIKFGTYRQIPFGENYDLVLMDDAGYGPGPSWGDLAPHLAERNGSIAIGLSNRPDAARAAWPEMLAQVLRGDPNFNYSEVDDGCKRIRK